MWRQILAWEHFDITLGQQQGDPLQIMSWWDKAVTVPLRERRHFNGMVLYTFWNLWKERNRRIFNNNSESVMQVAGRIKDDIEQRRAFS